MEACDAGHCKKAQINKPSTTQLPFLDHCHFFWPRRSDKVNPLQIPEVHQCFTKALAPQFGSTTMTWHGYVKDSQGTSGIAWEMTDTKVYSEFSTLCRLRFHVFSPSKKVFPCLVFHIFRQCSIIILVFWWIWMAGDLVDETMVTYPTKKISICNRCLPWRNCPASSFRMGLTKPPVGFDEIHHSSGRVRIFGHPHGTRK